MEQTTVKVVDSGKATDVDTLNEKLKQGFKIKEQIVINNSVIFILEKRVQYE